MLPQVVLPALPRMANFALWGEAVNRALRAEPGLFLSRYDANRRAACEAALEGCPVAEAIHLMATAGCFEEPCSTTASGLLRTLANYTTPSVARTAQWPRTPRLLACRLRRMAPQLRMTGIAVSFGRIDSNRVITIQSMP